MERETRFSLWEQRTISSAPAIWSQQSTLWGWVVALLAAHDDRYRFAISVSYCSWGPIQNQTITFPFSS